MGPESRMLNSWELLGTPEQKLINGFGLIFVCKRWQSRMLSFWQCYFWTEGDKTRDITLARAAVFSVTVKRRFLGKGEQRRSEGIALWSPPQPPSTQKLLWGSHESWHSFQGGCKAMQPLPQGAAKSLLLQLSRISRLYLKAARPSR